MATNVIGRALKDGLKAVLLWAALTVVLVALFRYPGWIISQFLALIFVVCFIALWGARILFWLLNLLNGGRGIAGPAAAAPNSPAGQQPGDNRRPCGTCNASGRMACPVCHGMRGRNEMPTTASGTSQWAPCTYCAGNGTVQCTSCSGLGYFNS